MAIPSSSAWLAAALAFTLAVWVKRAIWFASFRRTHQPLEPLRSILVSPPKVSIVIPARDEEKNLPACLSSLAAQEYPDFELVVVDDRSSDKTTGIVEEWKRSSRVPFTGVRVEKLPPGWTGKNHAMWVGSRAAAGEWILFTDADTLHDPKSLATAVETSHRLQIDLLTLAPETVAITFWEHVVQPLAVGSLALWFDPMKVNDEKSGVTLANGQFILIRKSAYEAVGGNESVKSEVVEDVELAKVVRANGFSVRFLDGTKLYSTRMYSSLAQIHRGWTRIFTYLFQKNVAAILHKIALFLIFSLFPFAVFAAEAALWAKGSGRFDAFAFALSATVCAFILVIRAIGNRAVRANPFSALLHPLGSIVMIWILSSCIVRILANLPSAWRGDLHK